MGKLELPLPGLGRSLNESAREMQERVRSQVPEEFRGSIAVKAFKRGEKTGLEISYDDRAEHFVYSAIEYPKGSGRAESAEPRKRSR